MASPVALDLSAAKTLFAFGERAAKHGLAIPGDLQQFIDEPEKMARLVKYTKAGAPFYQAVLPDIDWPETYKAIGLEAEYAAAKLVLPAQDTAIWWVPMVKGVTSNRIVSGHRKFGTNYWLYDDDLDTAVPKHDRDPNRDGNYIVGFRRTVEADEENAGKSADDLAGKKHKGITLPERLLLGAGFHVTTGQHLDVVNWTLCSGSRYRGGDVPGASWYPDDRRVCVDWYDSCDSFGILRSRSAVFCRILPA